MVPINSAPTIISSTAIAGGTVTLVAIPPDLNGQVAAFAGSGAAQMPVDSLALVDASSLAGVAGGTVVGDFSFEMLLTLGVGGTIAVGSTTSGLTISSLPPGVALHIAVS